jgi:outer membrane lipoprotein carrier protein
MKRVLGIVAAVVILAGTSVFAQKGSTLDKVSEKTKALKSLKADFSYTMVNKKANINEEKTGSLLISGDKYKLVTAGQTVISDGKTIWTYIKESNEVQINTLDNKDDALTPSKLLTSYNSNYKAKPAKEKPADPNQESFELTPNASKTFTKAFLTVDKAKLQVVSFSLYDKNGNVFTYKVTKYQADIPVVPADFVFDAKKFPGVEIIDMR